MAGFIFCLSGYAVPAKPGLLCASQPDGTTVNIYLEGDETGRMAFSPDGYLLTNDENGFYVIADIDSKGFPVSTGIRQINPENRTLTENEKISKLNKTEIINSFKAKMSEEGKMMLKPGPGRMTSTFPAEGEQRALVILVAYQNRDFKIEDPKDYYTRMLNEEGFSDNGATGSAKDYFVSSSSGIFQPQFDVYGPVKLEQKGQYYGANNEWGRDSRPQQLVIDACTALDDEIDFTLYDRDGDGIIDNVYIFYCGYGEADGGGANTIWPHSSNVSSYGLNLYFDGVKLEHYACSNEIQAYYDTPDGIGTFCHEFSHVMGLPDLYATSYNNSFTPGSWDLLDRGSYNNRSRTPPAYSSFERYALGWIEPIELEEGEVELPNLFESNKAYLVPTRRKAEYFLFENRQKIGFDTTVPGHGMLIWHIDYNSYIWNSNNVNNNEEHQYVDIIEADDIQSSGTIEGDPFPGTSNITEFSFLTSPSFVSWTKQAGPFRIYDISETEEGMIHFKVEEFSMADVEKVGVGDAGFQINGKTVSASENAVSIYDFRGGLITILENSSIVLPSGGYIGVSGKKAEKFIIP